MVRNYNGELVSDQPWWRAGMEMPRFFWAPAFSPAGLTFVTSDRFAPWKSHLLVAAMSGRRIERIALNQGPLQRERRESLLAPLGLRVRDVQQGPDGYLYVAAEKNEHRPSRRSPAAYRAGPVATPRSMDLRNRRPVPFRTSRTAPAA